MWKCPILTLLKRTFRWLILRLLKNHQGNPQKSLQGNPQGNPQRNHQKNPQRNRQGNPQKINLWSLQVNLQIRLFPQGATKSTKILLILLMIQLILWRNGLNVATRILEGRTTRQSLKPHSIIYAKLFTVKKPPLNISTTKSFTLL